MTVQSRSKGDAGSVIHSPFCLHITFRQIRIGWLLAIRAGSGRLAWSALKVGSEQSLSDGAAGIYFYCGHWIDGGRTRHDVSRDWCRAYLRGYEFNWALVM